MDADQVNSALFLYCLLLDDVYILNRRLVTSGYLAKDYLNHKAHEEHKEKKRLLPLCSSCALWFQKNSRIAVHSAHF